MKSRTAVPFLEGRDGRLGAPVALGLLGGRILPRVALVQASPRLLSGAA